MSKSITLGLGRRVTVLESLCQFQNHFGSYIFRQRMAFLKKRKFDIRDYIDDDVESGEVVEDQGEIAKEIVKKRTKQQRDAERAEEEQLANDYELDDEAEKESEDDDETRERQRALFVQQEEDKLKDVYEFLDRFMTKEEEKSVKLLELEKNLKTLELDKNSESKLEEKIEKSKGKESWILTKKENKKATKKAPLQKAHFQFDCVWQISTDRFLVHRVGFDQLGTLTVEKEYVGFKEKANTSWSMLYPFENGQKALILQTIAQEIKWYEFWIRPLSLLPSIPSSLCAYIEHEREGVLLECCEAFWPIENGNFYVVHFAFFPCKRQNSLLSVAFHVVETKQCSYLFKPYHRSLIMTPDVIARYPWKNGIDAANTLRDHQLDKNITYQQLKNEQHI